MFFPDDRFARRSCSSQQGKALVDVGDATPREVYSGSGSAHEVIVTVSWPLQDTGLECKLPEVLPGPAACFDGDARRKVFARQKYLPS